MKRDRLKIEIVLQYGETYTSELEVIVKTTTKPFNIDFDIYMVELSILSSYISIPSGIHKTFSASTSHFNYGVFFISGGECFK